jgi:predicted transcriptional regulator
MTQTEFARLLGVSQPIVSRWIKGDRLPSRRHWKAIRQVTGLSIASVVNFTAKRAA